MTGTPLLVVFSGVPGTGKTTVSRALAARLGAVYLRIDTIEQSLRDAAIGDVGTAGYGVAQSIANANLLLGHRVIADCVNPVRESRATWRDVAARSAARLVDILLVCSDEAEHRRRVEARSSDIAGLVPLSWAAVTRHDFEPRDDEHLCLDTAVLSPAELVERCAAIIEAAPGSDPARPWP